MAAGSLRDIGEQGLLRRIQARLGRRRGAVLLGPGDDAAALRVPRGKVLVVSQDDLVEGAHFERRWADPARLARRLMAINLSDLAAMGDVRPLGCTVSSGLPPGLPGRWFDAFLRGLERAAAAFGLPVAGGNLARSEKLFFSLAVFGAADRSRLVLRSGAKPGDLLAGVGPLGEAAAGLDLLMARRPVPAWGRALVRSFWEPVPQFPAGRILSDFATSMMDDSDGLARSARTLAEASGLRLEVNLDEAPVSPALRRWCASRGKSLREHQLRGGEDYGLVFTVPPGRWAALKRRLPGAYLLGRAVAGRPRTVPEHSSFEHFGSK